jgi:nitrite reductase/ring-hydroxylating ferredoxin subunit
MVDVLMDVGAYTPKRHGAGVTHEGDGGVYSQTWWPMCRSSDLAPGEVIGREFLDGKVAIFRGTGGLPSVVSTYCPHNGADLSIGKVCGDVLQCRFHRWDFAADGRCVRVGSGDKVPPNARVFKYPTVERYGLIWAFNGESPLFDLPPLSGPDEDFVFHPEIPIMDFGADPWVFMCNTLDFNHLRCVHNIEFAHADPVDQVRWNEYGYRYNLKGRVTDTQADLDLELGITGTNIFQQSGSVFGHHYGHLFPTGLPRAGMMRGYFLVYTRKSDGTPEDDARVKAALDFGMQFEMNIVREDLDILSTIRFTRGMLTKSDAGLSQFLDYLARYPRAHPGADFI